jgi:hypothetical protein
VSRPSDLKITDLRVAEGISGYGETCTGGSKTYPLLLKSRLLGEAT